MELEKNRLGLKIKPVGTFKAAWVIFGVLELGEAVLCEEGVWGVLHVGEGLGGPAPATGHATDTLTDKKKQVVFQFFSK